MYLYWSCRVFGAGGRGRHEEGSVQRGRRTLCLPLYVDGRLRGKGGKDVRIKAAEIGFVFAGRGYRMPIRGAVIPTEKGFRIEGKRIVLDLSV